MSRASFELDSVYSPTADRPAAIDEIARSVARRSCCTHSRGSLHGATSSSVNGAAMRLATTAPSRDERLAARVRVGARR
jgi:excinuclease UvrABC helicase subunit UvrB